VVYGLGRISKCVRIAAMVLWATVFVGAVSAQAADTPNSLPRDDYNWRNLAMGGGGYVTGIVAHPDEPGLIYLRTDVGGAYRFSPEPDSLGRFWVQLSDGFPFDQWNYYGVESLALDPSNRDIVYMAAGKYDWAGKGRLFVSRDRGKTWNPLPLETPMSANGANRYAGERLAIDPFNSKRIYFGSRTEGLFVSEDAGASWRKSAPLPAMLDDKVGISFVLPDPYSHAGGGKPARIYVGIWGTGLARSDDGGASWSLLGGCVFPAHAALSKKGFLVAAGNDGVYRLDKDKWTTVTPAQGRQFGGVSIDPYRPENIVAAEAGGTHQLPIYLSNDRGATWKTLSDTNGSLTHKSDVPWLPGYFFSSGTSSVLFDPQVKDRLWLTDWYGAWSTSNYRAPVPHFVGRSRGHEEMVIMTMISPSKGAWLLSGTVDTNGFRHLSTDLYPDQNLQGGGLWQTFGMDFSAADPNRIIRVGTIGNHGDDVQGGVTLSTDNGKTFKGLAWPYREAMKAAYSAKNPNAFVVLPKNDTPKSSVDGGVTWRDSSGVEGNAITSFWHWQHPLAADRVKDGAYYLYLAGRFYASVDGGINWTRTSTLPVSDTVFVEAVEGRPGWVYVALGEKGLFETRDGGTTFNRTSGVKRATLFSAGRPAPYSDRPALYVYGQVEGSGAHEILRSDDLGASWKIISVPGQPVGDQPSVMKADSQTYGRVFIGTNGRGIFVGTRK